MKELLKNEKDFYVPDVIKSLSSKKILTTELCKGKPIEHLINADQATRNKVYC